MNATDLATDAMGAGMFALRLLNLSAQAVAIALPMAMLGMVMCRDWRVMAKSMGGRGALRPAALGLAAFAAFLAPLVWWSCVEGAASRDRFYDAATQGRVVGALCVGSLALLLWGWKHDRRGAGLESLAILWGSQALLWWAGLRVERLGGFGVAIEFAPWASLVVTLLWLSTVAAVVELIDGVDGMAGLAVGLGALAIFAHALAFSPGDDFARLFAWLLASTALACAWLGRATGKALLGKNGAYLLGYWFAALTILARQKGAAAGVLTPILGATLLSAVFLFGFVERSLGFPKLGERGKAGAPGR